MKPISALQIWASPRMSLRHMVQRGRCGHVSEVERISENAERMHITWVYLLGPWLVLWSL
jgi:hypothetical protein